MTTEELRQQMHKEFENLKRKTERGMWWVRLDRVQEISDSIIDKTLQHEQERIVGVLKSFFDEIKNEEVGTGKDKTKELMAISDCIGLSKSLITNKSNK